MMSNPCYDEFSSHVKVRNDVQTLPHLEIYEAFYSLWLKYSDNTAKAEEIKHQLAILEHETVELANKNELNQAVENFRRVIAQLQPYHTTSTMENKQHKLRLTNLSRTVYDQRKLLALQTEEMKLLKEELKSALENNLVLNDQMRICKDNEALRHEQLNSANKQLERANATIRSLENDCQQLVHRIMNDKLRVSGEGVVKKDSGPDAQKGIEAFSADNAESDFTFASRLLQKLPQAVACEIQCHTSPTDINDIFFSSHTSCLVTAGSDSTVSIVEVGRENSVSPLKSQQLLCGGSVLCIDVVCDDSKSAWWLMGGGGDSSCRLWSLESGKLRAVLNSHTQSVTGTCFLGGCDRAVTGSLDRTIKLWDVAAHVKRSTSTTDGAQSSSTALWTIKTDSPVSAVAAATVVVTGHVDGVVRSWDVNSGQQVSSVSYAKQSSRTPVTCVAVDPTNPNVCLVLRKDSSICLVETRMNRMLQTLTADSFQVSRECSKATFSSNGQYVAAGSNDGSVCIWSSVSGHLVSSIRGHCSPVICASWRDEQLVTGDSSGQAVIWSKS